MANVQLTKNLRSYRVAHELTQDFISMKLNISRQAYSNYERGLRTPDIDLIIKLALIYKVTLDDFVLLPHNNKRTNPELYEIYCEDASSDTTFLSPEEMDYIIKFRNADESVQSTITTLLNAK